MAVNFKKGTGNPYDKHLTSTPVQADTSIIKEKTSHGVKNVLTVKDEHQTLNKGVVIPEAELLLLTITGGQTINLGNYESAKIGVSLRVPATKDTLSEAYDWASNWVSARIEEAITEAKG